MPFPESIRKPLLLAAAALASGCVSLEMAAPPVNTLATGASGQRRMLLEQGRNIYITKCAKCHSPEPVRNYSAARWTTIIPDMARETKLSSPETQAVTSYVLAVLDQS
jgi:mono/diheme cytochrome c family protein